MTKDWRQIARASGASIPGPDLERIAPVLDAMESAFRPLVKTLRWEDDPAVSFTPPTEDPA
jgi:hypothetical protein